MAVIYRLSQRQRSSSRNISKDMDSILSSNNVLNKQNKNKLRGLSPHANYTDRAAAAGRRS